MHPRHDEIVALIEAMRRHETWRTHEANGELWLFRFGRDFDLVKYARRHGL